MMICGKEEKVLPSISNQNYKGDLALSCTVVGRGALYIEFRFTWTFLRNQKSGDGFYGISIEWRNKKGLSNV